MAYDSKYGKVTFERGDIKEDEPVFILRAQDLLAVSAILQYATICAQEGCPVAHVGGIIDCANQIEEWQNNPENFTKLPGVRK